MEQLHRARVSRDKQVGVSCMPYQCNVTTPPPSIITTQNIRGLLLGVVHWRAIARTVWVIAAVTADGFHSAELYQQHLS
jgi:hypothetical protein